MFCRCVLEKYADFIEANRIEDSVERLKELRRLVSEESTICIYTNAIALTTILLLITLPDPRVTGSSFRNAQIPVRSSQESF